MALKSSEIEFLARSISRELERQKVLSKEEIYPVIKASLEELKATEEEIEKMALKLLQDHISRFPDVDKDLALEMIKKRLYEERGMEKEGSERESFLVNWISKRISGKAELKDPQRFRKVLSSAVGMAYEAITGIYREVAENLKGRGVREHTLEWSRRFSEEVERRLKEEMRRG